MKQSFFLRSLLLFFTLTIFYSPLNGFDFDNFFNSLFDEKSENTNSSTQNKNKKNDSQEIEQVVATTKKDNFLHPLAFTQKTEGEKQAKSTPLAKIKVPQQKRDAYLYYTQKLIDFFDIIRSHLDLTMKEQTSEFLSLSHSITSDLLSIDKQYLLKTFYHKDFDKLRKQIYQSLTKKTTQLNLRNIIKELQKLKELEERASNAEEAEERLTFEHNPHLSERKRSTLIKQINTIATKELKPLSEQLAKLPFHEYATAEKNKKIQQNKSKPVQNRSYRGNAPTWRPSYNSGSARRNPYYNNRNSASPYYNDYYGDNSYYPSTPSSSPSTSPSTPSTSPSSSSSSSGTTSSLPSDDKKKKDDKKTSLSTKIENLLNGFGKEITQAINELAQDKGLASSEPKEALFNKNLGILIDHPNIENYFAQIQSINQSLHELEATTKATSSKTTSSKNIKTLTPVEAEQVKKYQAFKKPLALALCRAKNAFCEPLTAGASRFPPEILFPDGINFNRAKRFNTIKQALDTLEPTYKVEIKKRTETLEALNKKYDDQSLVEFKATIDFLNEYITLMNTHYALIAPPSPAAPPTAATHTGLINIANTALKAVIEKPAYKEIKKELKDKLPLFIDTTKYPLYPVINEAAKKEILDLFTKIVLFHWQYVDRYHAIFTKQFPTQKIGANLPLLKDIVKDFVWDNRIINHCKTEIDKLIANNAAFQNELKIFKIQELDVDGKAKIEATWDQVIKP